MYQPLRSPRRRGRLSAALSGTSSRTAEFAVGLAVPPLTWALIEDQVTVLGIVAVVGLAWLSAGRPAATVLVLVAAIPLIMQGPHAQTAVLVGIAIPAIAVAGRLSTGAMSVRARHLVALPLMGAVMLSFILPTIRLATQTSRTADLVELVGGLVLLAVATVAPPTPYLLARTICVVGAALSGYVLFQGEYVDHRLSGLGLNPNYVGMLAALPLVAAVGLALCRRAPLWLLAAAPSAAALMATKSRGSVLAAAGGVVLIVMAGRSTRFKIMIVPAALLAVLLLPGGLEALESAGAGHRTTTELSYNNAVREQVAMLAVKVALTHPLRGIGYDMFAPYAALSPDLGIYMNTHNDFLRLAAEAGLPSLAMLIAVLWWACRWDGGGELRVLRAVVVCYAVGLCFANTLAYLTVTAAFWAALGCLLAHAPGHEGAADPGIRMMTIISKARRPYAHVPSTDRQR